MGEKLYNANVRNLFCNKEKNSEFLGAIKEHEALKNLRIKQILDSGAYFIYTFELDEKNALALKQKEALKAIESNWI